MGEAKELEDMHAKVRKKVFLSKNHARRDSGTNKDGYPWWWRSALCKMMQLELCDILTARQYGILKSILKTALTSSLKTPNEGCRFFAWTEFPVQLFQQRFHTEVVIAKKPDDAKTEFTVRLNAIWERVIPDYLCELMGMQAILSSQISTARQLKIGGLVASGLPVAWPVLHPLMKSHFASVMHHFHVWQNASNPTATN